MRPQAGKGRVGAMLLAMALQACAQSPSVQAARQGSLQRLQTAVASAGHVDISDVKALARAVAEREIHTVGDSDPSLRLQLNGTCIESLAAPLQRRARRVDRAGDTALGLLVEHQLAGNLVSDQAWSALPRPSRLAALLWGAVVPELLLQRRRAMSNPSLDVRQAALSAAVRAPCDADLESLAEVLRHDPDGSCRELAATALGIIGTPRAVQTLKDVWPRADVQLRLGLVNAWARLPAFQHGGAHILVDLAQKEPGLPGVAAAATLANGASDRAPLGRARLARALAEGTEQEQLMAIGAASLTDPDHARLVLLRSRSGSRTVRVAALARRLEWPDQAGIALAGLWRAAQGADSAALQAREVLAEKDDPRVVALLEGQLRSVHAATRLAAARGLWRLGDQDGVAKALADDAPRVRLATACMVLGTDR